jgi:Tol biopolymer transport system component
MEAADARRPRIPVEACMRIMLVVLLLGATLGGGRIRAWAAESGLLASGVDGITVESTRTAVSLPSMMGEGRFHEILYVYDIVFSPDSRWMTYIVDAIPVTRGSHQYYIYILNTETDERELVLETKTGPELKASFVWTGADTPALFWPEYAVDSEQAADGAGPAWERSLKVRGQDPRLRPGGAGIAFRRVADEAASLWYLPLGGGSTPQLISGHSSVFGPMIWSPDGSRLAFLSTEGAEFGECLWTVAPGEEPSMVSPIPVVDIAWAPTSDAVAVKTEMEELVLLSVSGGEELNRTTAVRAFDWSPDGSGLACVVQPDFQDAEVLVFMPRRGTPVNLMRSLAPGGWDLSLPQFAADGSTVYVGGAAGRDVTGDGQYFERADRALFRCDLRTGTSEPLPMGGSAVRPVLSLDGTKAVVVVEKQSGSFLWGMDLATGHAVELGQAPVEKYAYELAWSPDGRLVAYEDSMNINLATLAWTGG